MDKLLGSPARRRDIACMIAIAFLERKALVAGRETILSRDVKWGKRSTQSPARPPPVMAGLAAVPAPRTTPGSPHRSDRSPPTAPWRGRNRGDAAGFRWIFVVHMHGAPNHNRALDQAGDYFHDTYGGEMVNLWGTGFGGRQDLRGGDEAREDGLGVHGGMNETSHIMFLRPDLAARSVADAEPGNAELGGARTDRQIEWMVGVPGLTSPCHRNPRSP